MPYGLPVQAHPTARQGGLETPGEAQVAGQEAATAGGCSCWRACGELFTVELSFPGG